MRTTSSISFYCRESKRNKNGLSPVEVSIIINGERKFINLPIKYNPIEFNRTRQPKEIIEAIDAWRTRINGFMTEMVQNGIPLTSNNLKTIIQTGGVKSYTIKDLFSDYLKILKSRIGIDLTSGAYRKYELTSELFLNEVDGEQEVTNITPSVIQQFYISLQKKYNTATSASYIAKTKTFIQFGLDNNKLKINPFQGLKVHREKKVIDYLTEDEINKIKQAEIDNDCLNNVRDAFLMQVYSGLAYIDLEHLTKEDIKITEEGTHYIQKDRVKTGVQYTSVILPDGIEILKKHNYKLKVISNQKMNIYLKQVMNLAGITHNLTTHLGRKTYGHILLNKGVRLEVVAKALGHSNSKTTAKYYAEVMSNTVVNEIVQSVNK